MSHPIRILAPLLLIGTVAAGGYWLYDHGKGQIAPTNPAAEVLDPRAGVAEPLPVAVTSNIAANAITNTGNSERTEAITDNTNADAAQGVKGRVVLPDGMPAAEVPVFLIESIMNDPIRVYLMSRSGQTTPPVSMGSTAADGTFALGVPQPGKTYDLRIASDAHPELSHPSVNVHEDDWYDTGDLELKKGLIVTGRVIDAASRVGLADVKVYLTNSNQAYSLIATPGREHGLSTVSDHTGRFRFTNVPREGMVNLVAKAEGFASETLTNQKVRRGGTTIFKIEMAKGQPIAGVVVDTAGEPLDNIQVTAEGLSQKTPQTASTRTNGRGVFEFQGLREGPYRLVTTASSYAENETPPILTGDTNVKLVLLQRPWVKLRVKDAKGRPIKAYRISLKRHFPNSPLGIGNVQDFRDRSITPGDYPSKLGGNWAVVHGLPAGQFVFQIRERNHAKTLSQPFTVRNGLEAAEVEATLTLGAMITGTVIDDRGNSISGAVVSTDMNNGLAAGGGVFLEFLKKMVPERHTVAQTRTGRQGRFRIRKLAFADYMLRISHPDYCEGKAMNILLTEPGQIADAGVVRLTRGTIVEGFTTVNGHAVGQIKVNLGTPPESTPIPRTKPSPRPRENNQALFSANAISDNDGRYRLLKRVPPGIYKIQAMRVTGNSNPFLGLLDMRETEKTITITPGQGRLKIDFNLPAR